MFDYTTPSEVNLLQLKCKTTPFNILHVGETSAILDLKIIDKHSHPLLAKDYRYETHEIEIILINEDSNPAAKSNLIFDSNHLVVPYTKKRIKTDEENLIHFSLVPILLKYIINIKNALSFVNHKDVKNSSKLFLTRLKKKLDENLDDTSLSIGKLSKLMFMSRSNLSKKIKNRTGLKPTEFINNYKIEKSKHLLTVTNWQVCRIADSLGFSSQHYYSRIFKEKENMSPVQYRNRQKTVQINSKTQ